MMVNTVTGDIKIKLLLRFSNFGRVFREHDASTIVNRFLFWLWLRFFVNSISGAPQNSIFVTATVVWRIGACGGRGRGGRRRRAVAQRRQVANLLNF